ncbi:MAG: exodeoxyribonuclease VII large subunit [Paludibacteraceae bacterium]|nr:exodeoxyribonuclease VII large subunit [Paludibacteraceae bacterium]
MKQYTLSELCQAIEQVLQFELGDIYWVRAEIASLTERGHCYMELVEKAKNNTVAAKVRATCWQQVYHLLSAYFATETGQTLSVGMQVLLQVEVSFHSVYGLSLNVVGIDPTFTLGDLARQRQLTILRLQEDGVMDLQRALTIPSLPRRIAVISAADAAGYGDFCHQLLSNNSGFLFRTQLFPAVMQGDQSPASIIAALEQIAYQVEQYDVVVIVRGGGATTDLRNFDDYSLAFHCANFPLPIIAGIGHTRDVSVVDMVVHTSVKTPTAAAEWLISAMQEQADRLAELQLRLQRIAQHAIRKQQHQLDNLWQSLRFATQRRLHRQRAQLELWAKTIALHSPERIYRMGYTLTTVNGKIVKSINDVKAGDHLLTHTADGTITSEVKETICPCR